MNKNIIIRLYEYQLERFPIQILLFTTFSIVLGSFVIILKDITYLIDNLNLLIIGTIICLLYTFHIRVLDEEKDLNFDNKYHKDRPIQRGLIQIKELIFIDKILILIQIILILIFSFKSLLFWLITYVYSIIARHEFFLKDKIRKNFILYNVLNLFQMFFLQLFLYSLIIDSINWLNPLLYLHFFYVLGKIFLIEIARKLKIKTLENKGKDTYSSRYGLKKAGLLYSITTIITSIIFLIILIKLNTQILIIIIFLILSLIQILSIINYIKKQSTTSIKIIEISVLIFYILTDFLLLFAII